MIVYMLVGMIVISCQGRYDTPLVDIQDANSPLLKALDCEKRLPSMEQWDWSYDTITQGVHPIETLPNNNFEYAACSYFGQYTTSQSDILTTIIIFGLDKYPQRVSLNQTSADFEDFSGDPTSISLPPITGRKMVQKCFQDGEQLNCQIVIGYEYEELFLRVNSDIRIPTQEIESIVGNLLEQLNEGVEKELY
jgi:hypothetical protein